MKEEESVERRIESNLREAFRREALDSSGPVDMDSIRQRVDRETGVRDLMVFGFSRLFQTFLVVFVRFYRVRSERDSHRSQN